MLAGGKASTLIATYLPSYLRYPTVYWKQTKTLPSAVRAQEKWEEGAGPGRPQSSLARSAQAPGGWGGSQEPVQSRVTSGGELRARRFQEALPATPSSHEEPGPAAHWSRQAPFKGLQTLPGLSGPRPWPHQPWGLATCSVFSSRRSAWLPGSLLQPLSTVPPVAPPLRARPPAVEPATQ